MNKHALKSHEVLLYVFIKCNKNSIDHLHTERGELMEEGKKKKSSVTTSNLPLLIVPAAYTIRKGTGLCSFSLTSFMLTPLFTAEGEGVKYQAHVKAITRYLHSR